MRRGIEENRKLLVIKTRKVDEVSEGVHALKQELGTRSEDLMRRIAECGGTTAGEKH